VQDDYLDELLSEGDLDSEGRFTLDVARGRTKLAKFRFIYIVDGILASISACIMAGCEWVRVHRRPNYWEIEHSPLPITREIMDSLLERIFDSQQPVWLREMGLAFNSLYPRHCKSLSWSTADGLQGKFEDSNWTTCAGPRRQYSSLEIETESTWRNPLKWLNLKRKGIDELAVLRMRTRWSAVPVCFPGKSSYELDPPQAPDSTWAVISVLSEIKGLGLAEFQGVPAKAFRWERPTQARASIRACLLSEPGLLSEVLLVYRGLTLAPLRVVSLPFPFQVVLNPRTVDLDASRAHIAPIRHLGERISTVRTWIVDGIREWLKRMLKEGPTTEDRALLLPRFLARLSYKKLRAPLRRLPVLAGSISLEQLEKEEGLERKPDELPATKVMQKLRDEWLSGERTTRFPP